MVKVDLSYPFDHIRRNWDIRKALHHKAMELLKIYDEETEKALNIESDDEYDKKMDELEKTIKAEFWKVYKTEFALCYPESRNKWFIDFVNSFNEGYTRLTEKQYYVFKKYCEDNEDTWRNGTCYCRVGNKLISLHWKNQNRGVTIETFTPAKELLKTDK